ncbi:MAG TPA: TIGR03560 family F420-dependent LLM class oxidoreductase [Roseiflexaceae bacterium]
MEISIMIEGQDGLTWLRWQRIAVEVERLGFAGLFRSDHFTNPQPPDKDSLEMIVSLAYLAGSTSRIHFGPLVAPFSFRDPALLARQAAAIDDLSGGRMILGVGAGWQDREHALFGYDLGDVPTRMARLEEGLEVVTRLLRGDAPATYEGRFYRLRGATLLPRPRRPGGPPIAIGGNGPRRTLPLAARYADIWNGVFIGPDEFRARSAALDDLLRAAGRKPTEVRRTVMTGIFFGGDRAALDRRLDQVRQDQPELAGLPTDALIATLRAARSLVVGTPDMVAEQIAAYAAAGAEELMLQWLDQDDIEGLRALGQLVAKSYEL